MPLFTLFSHPQAPLYECWVNALLLKARQLTDAILELGRLFRHRELFLLQVRIAVYENVWPSLCRKTQQHFQINMRTKLKIGLLPYLNRTPATVVLLDTFQYCHLNYKKKKSSTCSLV